MTTAASTPEGTGTSLEGKEAHERASEGSISERIAKVLDRPGKESGAGGTAGVIDPGSVHEGSAEPERSMEEYHAEFVAAHVQAQPEPLPEGAAEDVDAVVAHLHAVVDVLDVIEAAEAEGRVATESEVAALEEPLAVIAAGEFHDTADDPAHDVTGGATPGQAR